MILHTFWVQLKGYEDSPECTVAWDDESFTANQDGYDADVQKVRRAYGDDIVQWREIMVHVPTSHIQSAFDRPTIAGDVEGRL